MAVLGLIAFIANGCGGGGGSETPGEGSEIVEMQAVMGPIVGADVWVAPMDDQTNIVASGITGDSQDLNEAGHVTLNVPARYNEIPLLVTVSGGEDVDVNDDGVRDQVPTANDTFFNFVVPTPADLEGMTVVANPLLLYASDYLLKTFEPRSNPPVGGDPPEDPEVVRTVMKRVAKAILQGDVDADGTIGWPDIVSFHPLLHQPKSRVPWGYVVDDVARHRQGYQAKLQPEYSYWYKLEPQSLAPYDFDEDGNWRNDNDAERGFKITFRTDKNGYTTLDLLEGQGARGGTVILPGSWKISYYWFYVNEFNEWVRVDEFDDPEPPLWLEPFQVDAASESKDIGAWVGGNIVNPQEAEVGEYTVHYKTGDGLQHAETLYLHENKAETFFYAIPEIELDANGLINSFIFRFEDGGGNPLEDPPFLKSWVTIFLWDDVATVNSLVRGDGYYAPVSGSEEGQNMIFLDDLSLIDPAKRFYPTSNGHKIYFEDAWLISIGLLCGDGVQRGFMYTNDDHQFYPHIGDWSFANGQVTVPFHHAVLTGREVTFIRYKFNNTEWGEVAGDTLTVDIPVGADLLYVTAKDTAGFYKYPPWEIEIP
jgi:hypothetical protein